MADAEQTTAEDTAAEQTTPAPEMTAFEMQMTTAQKAKLMRLAEQRGLSEEEAVGALIDEAHPGTPFKARKGSFFEGIEHLIGSGDGPPDLLRDPDRMAGYGR